jgi:hypothetical protein
MPALVLAHQLAQPVAARSTHQTVYPQTAALQQGLQMLARAQGHQLAQPLAVRSNRQMAYPEKVALQQGL